MKLLLSNTQRRYMLPWLRSLKSDYLLSTPSPWITFDAINYLKTRIRPGWRIFEYGSGGSTLFWLRLGAHCVSVEHDPVWYSLIQARIELSSQMDYRLVLPSPMSSNSKPTDPADPEQYSSFGIPDHSFEQYVTQIDSFPDQYFDMVVVDGRARPACIVHGASKVKSGGLLVLDNADRDYYLEKTRHLVRHFTKYEFSGVIPGEFFYSQTNIYEQPSSPY